MSAEHGPGTGTPAADDAGVGVVDLTTDEPTVLAIPGADEPEADVVDDDYGMPRGIRPVREALVLCALIGVVVTVLYRLWRAHIRVPFAYGGDGVLYSAIVKNIRDTGWYLHNPRIGAPFGGNMYDFPLGGENVHWLSMKVLGFVMPGYAATINAYFILSFFLVGLSAYFVARYLKFGVAPSLVVGVLYTFIPYHQAHGAGQVSRSAYYMVPLVALVILWLLDYRTRFFESPAGDRLPLRLRRRRWAFVFVVAVVLGGSDTQHAIFAACILTMCGIALVWRDRNPRPLVIAVVIAVGIGGSLLVNNAPYLLYRHSHGSNTVAAQRSLSEQDAYALSISAMLLPTRGHRIEAFASLEQRAREGATNQSEAGMQLGLIGSLAFLFGMFVVFARAFTNRRALRHRRGLDSRLARYGGIALVAVLIGTVQGFSYLLALGGLTMQRTWNRISVIIALFAFLIAAAVFELGLARIRAHAGRYAAVAVAATVALVLLVGVFDQTSDFYVYQYPYQAVAQRYEIDHAFFTQLEARLPHAAMVFEYPVVPFPENPPVVNMPDYEQLIGYLHTNDLRWSYGAVKGRPDADWQLELAKLPTQTQLAALAAARFQGVYVNRAGYADGGKFVDALTAQLGAPMLQSSDGRLLYFDLAPARAALQAKAGPAEIRGLRDAILRPVLATFPSGFYALEASGSDTWHWAPRHAQLALDNPTSRSQPVVLDGVLAGQGPVEIRALGRTWTQTAPQAGAPWHLTVTLPPGTTTFDFTARGPAFPTGADTRTLYFRLSDLVVQTPALDRALCRVALPGPNGASTCH